MSPAVPKQGDLWKHKSGEYHTITEVSHGEVITWGADKHTFRGPLAMFLAEFAFQRRRQS